MNTTIIQIILIFWSSILLWVIFEYIFYRLNNSHEDPLNMNSNSFGAKNKN